MKRTTPPLFDKIGDLLGEDRKRMLRLEDLQSIKKRIDDDFIYRQGFIDGVTLLKYIQLL